MVDWRSITVWLLRVRTPCRDPLGWIGSESLFTPAVMGNVCASLSVLESVREPSAVARTTAHILSWNYLSTRVGQLGEMGDNVGDGCTYELEVLGSADGVVGGGVLGMRASPENELVLRNGGSGASLELRREEVGEAQESFVHGVSFM